MKGNAPQLIISESHPFSLFYLSQSSDFLPGLTSWLAAYPAFLTGLLSDLNEIMHVSILFDNAGPIVCMLLWFLNADERSEWAAQYIQKPVLSNSQVLALWPLFFGDLQGTGRPLPVDLCKKTFPLVSSGDGFRFLSPLLNILLSLVSLFF